MSRTLLVICFIMAISFPAHAELDLKPVHPDESAEETFNQRLSIENALRSLGGIESALKSFAELTQAARGKFSKEKLKAIGNTDADVQTLGFMNWPGTIKGTILKQEYMLKKLNYELAQKKLKLGEINKEELSAAHKEYKKAEENFQAFWDSFGIGD